MKPAGIKKFFIRKIKKTDTDEIAKIQKAITGRKPTPSFMNAVKKVSGRCDTYGFVAEADGKVVGFMIAYIFYGIFGLEKSAWIGLFGVEPGFMGRGIGKALAEYAMRQFKARGITGVFSSVLWDSMDLLSFFKSLGFDRSGFINLQKDLTGKLKK